MNQQPPSLLSARRAAFPIGASVTLDALTRDPYAVYEVLREAEPITWLSALEMWYVTRHEDVQRVLLDTTRFTTVFERSPIHETFGEQILTSEGLAHGRYRRALQGEFAKFRVQSLAEKLRILAERLVESVAADGTAEIRRVFASRLPIQAMLEMCGLPLVTEHQVRRWYDHFEASLADFRGDELLRQNAGRSIDEFYRFLQDEIDALPVTGEPCLLRTLVSTAGAGRLTDDEVKRNLGIVFFGGISTVEALILNCLWALSRHPESGIAAKRNPQLIAAIIDETIRWHSPVQSATRHARCAVKMGAAYILEGEIVNCMLGAANRDPRIFSNPECFVLHRPNIRQHLAFAAGPHACLGFHLAKLEVQIALEVLLEKLPQFRIVATASEAPSGYEFHQPRRLQASWSVAT